MTLAEIYALAGRITRRYVDSGYLLSRALVPEQVIEDGVVQLQVIEGYVDSVTVEGVHSTRSGLLGHYGDRIKASRPLKRAVLERYLLLANDIPGLRFKAVLSPSAANTGAAALTLTASDARWSGSVSFDNRGADYSGPWQGLIELSGHNLLSLLESTTVRYATVPDDLEELHYWAVRHEQLLSAEGLRLAVDVSGADSETASAVLSALEVETQTRSAGLTVSYPILRSRERNQRASVGLAMKDAEVELLGAIYDQSDGFGGGGVTVLSASVVQGLDIIDAQVTSYVSADPDFTYVSLYAWRSQHLFESLRADVRLSAQLTNESLPAIEQAGLGGEHTVRGYESSEWTGDELVNTSLELVYQLPAPRVESVQLHGFYDYGKIWRNNPQVGERRSQSADASGAGTRVKITDRLGLDLEAARTLDDDSEGKSRGWEFFMRVRAEF